MGSSIFALGSLITTGADVGDGEISGWIMVGDKDGAISIVSGGSIGGRIGLGMARTTGGGRMTIGGVSVTGLGLGWMSGVNTGLGAI